MALFNSRYGVWYAGGGVLTFLIVLISFASYRGAPKSIISHATESLKSDLLDQINNATLGFEKIFVINLPSRTDHRDALDISASLTGLHLEFIDGVTEVLPKVLPPGEHKLSHGEVGSWRAHMNVAQKMVEENIQSALIMEDDVDWDIRIKSQMQAFARASRLLVQPRPGTKDSFLDPTYPHPSPSDEATNFYVGEAPSTAKPTTSPYGDTHNWDVFWLGHCGTYFPDATRSQTRPIGRAVLLDDETVPEPQHINMIYASDELIDTYPPHTRVVSRANMNMCTFVYAMTLAGARRLLYEVGIRRVDEPMDIELRRFCDGADRPTATCLTVQPMLFQHHRPAGNRSSFSDIGNHGGVNEVAYTRNVRWSTRLNWEKLMAGEEDYVDLFKDGEPGKDFGYD